MPPINRNSQKVNITKYVKMTNKLLQINLKNQYGTVIWGRRLLELDKPLTPWPMSHLCMIAA